MAAKERSTWPQSNIDGQVRRAIKGFINDFPEYERLLPHVRGTTKLMTWKFADNG